MSQIPRRTSEFQASSNRKSANPRPSRLGLSTAGSSSALRSGHARPSATPSMARMTPSRTPNRSNSKDRNTLVPMTAEKEKAPVDDKAFIHAKTHQVLEELTTIDGFTELVQKGLKSMTHKQFIMILQHFIMPIAGNVKLDTSNYVEYISNFIHTMDYPYTINKSSLKTPSAPHCQNGIIILLAWLTEFSVKDDGEPLVKTSMTDDFTVPEMSATFMFKTSKAFVLWNNQEEAESDRIMQEIRQTYIEQKIGKGMDLQEELTRLKIQIEQLRREAKPKCFQKDFIEKRDELKQLVNQCDVYRNANQDLEKRISELKADLERKLKLKDEANRELQALRNKLTDQKMTQDERNALLIEISQAKSVLASKKQAAMELNEASTENEIQLSNLIQKKFLLIDKLNNFLYKFASNLEIAGLISKFDPGVYEIKTTKIDDALGLDGEIEQWNQGWMVLHEKYRKALDSLDQSVLKLTADKHQLNAKNEMILEENEKVKSLIERAIVDEDLKEKELQAYVHTMEQNLLQNDIEIKKKKDEIKALNENILKHRAVIAQISADHAAFKAKSLKDCKRMYEKRKQEAIQRREQLNEMNQILRKFDKTKKPFPDDVQNTINEVMMKRVDSIAEKR